MGLEFWTENAATLKAAQSKYGVPPEIIVALIGVETHYGTRMGNRRVLDSLVTLTADYPRRSAFFGAELRTFLNTARKEKYFSGQCHGFLCRRDRNTAVYAHQLRGLFSRFQQQWPTGPGSMKWKTLLAASPTI